VRTLHKLRAAAAGLRRVAFHEGILLIPLAAVIASLPSMVRGVSCGHDFGFHLISWFETQRAWSQGILYPHWAQSPNWGAGEARFVFYPPLSWIFGACLGYLMTWRWVPAALTFVCFATTGLSTRTLARTFLPAANATLAGVLATAAPYVLFAAYERTAFSELAAAAMIPLLLLYTLRKTSRSFDGGGLLLTVIFAAIWLTNAPAGVMASYLLVFATIAAAVLQRSWVPVLRAVIAGLLGLGLAAVYLIPAAWEQRWIAINQVLDVGMRVQDSWLFARHASPDMELHDQILRLVSTILVFTAASALAALALCFRNRKLPATARHLWMPLALLVPIILLLQFPISAPLWHLPKMQFLQFPWRWLIVLDVPFTVFLAAATPFGTRRARIGSAVGWTVILFISAAIASSVFYQFCDDEDDVDNQVFVFRAGTGVDGIDEYAAVGSDNTLVSSDLPDACLVTDPTRDLGVNDSASGVPSVPDWYPEQGSCDQTFSAKLWQNEDKVLQIDSDHDGYIVLRLRRYPAWQITVNGQPTAAPANREDGLMAIPVRAGPSTIDVRWTATPDVLWGRWVSLAALMLFAALWVVERRLAKRRA
jgi:hypothetical protein